MTAFSDVYSPAQDLSFKEATCAWKRTPNVLCIQPSKADEVWDKVVLGLRGLYELVMKQQLQQEQSLGY